MGSITFTNGDQLSGEFKNGKIAGRATLTYANGDQYAGEVSGLRFEGSNTGLTGTGTYSFHDGGKYIGEMVDGKFNGKGTLYYPNGDKYVGQFSNDRLNGHGEVTHADGSSYVGEFKDDLPTGRGGMAGPKDKPVRFDDLPPLNQITIVKLTKRGGVFEVPVLLNGVIPLAAIIDSGATDVSVPVDVYLTLRRTGTVTDADDSGEAVYQLANGSEHRSPRFRIRSITIGNMMVRDVMGSVADSRASILLGQSFFQKFRSSSFDNQKHTLTLVE